MEVCSKIHTRNSSDATSRTPGITQYSTVICSHINTLHTQAKAHFVATANIYITPAATRQISILQSFYTCDTVYHSFENAGTPDGLEHHLCDTGGEGHRSFSCGEILKSKLIIKPLGYKILHLMRNNQPKFMYTLCTIYYFINKSGHKNIWFISLNGMGC